MRRDLVLEAGGYDASLRARKAQGCEDWKLYLLLAERSHFALVPDHLVGYRQAATAMSGDVGQMLRSDAIVREEMLELHPNNTFQLEDGRLAYINWMLYRETENGNAANRKTLIEMKAKLGGNSRKSVLGRGREQIRTLRRRHPPPPCCFPRHSVSCKAERRRCLTASRLNRLAKEGGHLGRMAASP